jgi:hypothetical protein
LSSLANVAGSDTQIPTKTQSSPQHSHPQISTNHNDGAGLWRFLSGTNYAEVCDPSGTEGMMDRGSDPYSYGPYDEFYQPRPVPFEDRGGAGALLEGVRAHVDEWWSVTETEFTFRTLLNVAVLSETPGAYAYAYTALALRLDIGELCSYNLFDVGGNVTGTGTLQPGPWHFDRSWSLQVIGVGEKEEMAYFRMELSPYPSPSHPTVPDGGSTGLLAGLSLLSLAFARRLSHKRP